MSALDNILGLLDAPDDLTADTTADDLTDHTNLTDLEYLDEIALMLQLEAPEVNIAVQPELVKVTEFDHKHNILDLTVRDEFRTEIIFDETHVFSQPIPTTVTIEGQFSNVRFHEMELIHDLIPDDRVVMCKCNYGTAIYPGYTPPAKPNKTKRGRKPKAKKKKDRKKQGTGEEFNSQITFVIRSMYAGVTADGIVATDAKVYKIKVFRTGVIQLPGVRQHTIEDVISCTRVLVQMLNFHLHPGEPNPARISHMINMNPVMKNYKFVIHINPGCMIDLAALKRILLNGIRGTTDPDGVFVADVNAAINPNTNAPAHPKVFALKYTRQDATKLSIKFATPILRKPKKKTRINIFMRGKVNILGAFDAACTRQICEYLHWIFLNNWNTLVVNEGPVYIASPNTSGAWTSIQEIPESVYAEAMREIDLLTAN